jgi:hypothetical protein
MAFAQNVEDRAKEIAIEVLYDKGTDEFEQYMNGMESEDINKPLMAALKAIANKGQWNNSGWMYEAIRHLEEVRKLVEREQTRDVERFEDQAREELKNALMLIDKDY